MNNYRSYKFEVVHELPKRGKKKVLYWLELTNKYEAYVYECRSWTKVDERNKK